MCPRPQYTDLTFHVPHPVDRSGLLFVVILRVSIQAKIFNLVFIKFSMCSRPKFTDLIYMLGTGPCAPMTIILGSVI